ncbi:hypothetical protein EV182_001031 [Spiromyces aspiralis]|uniref:Uncharacterized protein n=1 Tax=Spiromyces aspiralis TaxID=68401 RepID=A0ACC1HX67_9FUNG|nr:hypothetical protein EV182_001031 [Spiromyces aspiralis]
MDKQSDSGGSGGGGFRPYASPNPDSLNEPIPNPLSAYSRLSANSRDLDTLALAGVAPPNVRDMQPDDLDLSDFEAYEVKTFGEAFRLSLQYCGISYLNTLLSNPFYVARTLLQVQYSPNDAPPEPVRPSSSELGEEIFSDGPDMYHDPNQQGKRGRDGRYYSPMDAHERVAKTDHDGYVVSVSESGAAAALRPAYQVPRLPSNQIKVLRTLVSHPTEGFLSPFKGTFTRWFHSILQTALQGTIEGLLNEVLGVYDTSMSLDYWIPDSLESLTHIFSSVITGVLLSPLELAYTRLIVQSRSPVHRKYNSMRDALKKIYREEGGLKGLYLDSHYLIPTICHYTLYPIFNNLNYAIIEHGMGINPYDHPVRFYFADYLWKIFYHVLDLPVSTIRKRLFVQPRYRFKDAGGALVKQTGRDDDSKSFMPLRTAVKTSPIYYTGMLNCAWRIITEEGDPNYYNRVLRAQQQPQPSVSSYYYYNNQETGRRTSQSQQQQHHHREEKGDRRSGSTESRGDVSITRYYSGRGSHWGLRGLYTGFFMEIGIHTGMLCANLLSLVKVEEESF